MGVWYEKNHSDLDSVLAVVILVLESAALQHNTVKTPL